MPSCRHTHCYSQAAARGDACARCRQRSSYVGVQITLYVGLVAFAVIIVTLCFVASLATSSSRDHTRRHCRACCDRFLRLRDEPELPPEMTSSSSHPVDVRIHESQNLPFVYSNTIAYLFANSSICRCRRSLPLM